MPRLMYILSFIFLFQTAGAQLSNRYITNLDVSVSGNKIHINYDLLSDTSQTVYLRFISDSYQFVTPNKLNGDIGQGVGPGPNKHIVWDAMEDMNYLDKKLRPVIFLESSLSRNAISGGPGYASLSLAVPGTGDYFVSDPKQSRIKPYQVTLASFGLIALGMYAGKKRYEEPGELIEKYSWYYSWDPVSREFRYTPVRNEVMSGGKTRYFLFKYDREVLVASGIAVWVADIIYVLGKGTINNKMRSSLSESGLHLSHGKGSIGLGYRF